MRFPLLTKKPLFSSIVAWENDTVLFLGRILPGTFFFSFLLVTEGQPSPISSSSSSPIGPIPKAKNRLAKKTLRGKGGKGGGGKSMTTILLTWVGEEGREAVSTGVQHPTDGRSVLRCWIGRRYYNCFYLGFPT